MDIALTSEEKRIYLYYIDMLASVINKTDLDEPPEGFNWLMVCRHAQRNSVLNILGYALEKIENGPPEQIARVVENDKRYYILKETSQLFDVEKVLQEFEKEGIRNLPLKGYFMKQLYPQSDFRTMTDLDIFVDKKNFKKIEKIFERLGYANANVVNAVEIHFQKDLQYFEFHCDLNEGEDTYYKNVWENVNHRENYEYSYCMNPEDFYIYMVYHCAKHFSSGGIGLRMLMDLYVYCNNYPELNFDYINSCFRKLGIETFAKRCRALAINWFSTDKTVIDNFGEFIIYCSTFGTRDICFFQDNARHDGGKIGYWIKQVFIPYRSMKKRYSYLTKLPVLLPFSWVQYWFTRIFVHRDLQLKQGFDSRRKNLDNKNGEFVINLMKELEIKF